MPNKRPKKKQKSNKIKWSLESTVSSVDILEMFKQKCPKKR